MTQPQGVSFTCKPTALSQWLQEDFMWKYFLAAVQGIFLSLQICHQRAQKWKDSPIFLFLLSKARKIPFRNLNSGKPGSRFFEVPE